MYVFSVVSSVLQATYLSTTLFRPIRGPRSALENVHSATARPDAAASGGTASRTAQHSTGAAAAAAGSDGRGAATVKESNFKEGQQR